MNKFFEPLGQKYNKKNNAVINFVGALGIFPAVMIGRKLDSVWIALGIALLWWIIVVFTYLTYRYLKSK
jgi:hypothetical protein